MIDGGAMCPHYYCHSPGPGPPITRSVFINNQNTSLHHMFLGIAVLMLVSVLASLVWYQDYRQWETTVERPMRLQQCPRVRPCLSLLINISLLFLLLGSHPLWWLLQPSQEEITTRFSEVTKAPSDITEEMGLMMCVKKYSGITFYFSSTSSCLLLLHRLRCHPF